MQSPKTPDLETIVKSLMQRRDSISSAAARAIRNLQAQLHSTYQQGWDDALAAAIDKVSNG